MSELSTISDFTFKNEADYETAVAVLLDYHEKHPRPTPVEPSFSLFIHDSEKVDIEALFRSAGLDYLATKL